MTDWLEVVAGLAVLVFAGDVLVKGAVNLALRLGIPALVVGLTVVAFGTSAPELLVSIQAALLGQPGIALGNVVGSNIANVLLVLGVPALIQTLRTSDGDSRRGYLTMIAGSALFTALLFAGPLGRVHGAILLAGLAFMLWDNLRTARAHRHRQRDDDVEGADPELRGWQIAAYLAVGLAGLPVGADLLVDGASAIARTFGLSETVIGLTLVAVGTSLPELAATTMAAIRRQAAMAVGNVIGSNLFNLLGIIGITAMVRPLAVPDEILRLDVWVMLATSLLLAPFVLGARDATRTVGIVFCLFYAGYIALLVLT